MTTISDIDEEVTDIDWFALDQEGFIGHFASGGFGGLPRSVAASKEDLEKVFSYFKNQPLNATAASPSSKALASVATKDEKGKAKFFKSYLEMASRGLYSFNFVIIGKRPAPYYLVARPAKPLHVNDLPDAIKTILRRTILPVIFTIDEGVSVEAAR
jgi:hypothetical protein